MYCRQIRFAFWLVVLAAGLASPLHAEELPAYVPAELPAESLTSVGSDSMDGLVSLWIEEYRKRQPNVRVQAVSRGSATAPPALIEGSADLGPMARPMKSAEREQFFAAYGFQPTQIRTALAAVAVYTPRDNPLSAISVDQLKQMFAAGRSQSLAWKEFAVDGKLASEQVQILGQNASVYLTGYFRQRVLLQEDFSKLLMTTTTHRALFQALSMNDNSIGYGIVRDDFGPEVKMIAVKKDQSARAYLPTMENIVSGAYPLSRSLNIYVVREPGKQLDPALADFLQFVLSKEGQEIVSTQGLIPLPAEVAREEITKLN